MLRFARNDVKGRFRVKLGMMYEKEMPRQAEHDKLVKNWRNKRNGVQGECRDRPLAGWHDRTAAADAEGVQQLTPQMAAYLQADLSNMHVPKRCGRPKPVADVSVRLILHVRESV